MFIFYFTTKQQKQKQKQKKIFFTIDNFSSIAVGSDFTTLNQSRKKGGIRFNINIIHIYSDCIICACG